MASTVLINAASVAAGQPCAVVAYHTAQPFMDFTVSCTKAHSIAFYVSDSTFTTTAGASLMNGYSYSGMSATTGTGTRYELDAGSAEYIACVVTNNDSTLAATISVTVDGIEDAGNGNFFGIDEARAFNGGTLSSDIDFPDALISAFENSFREWFTQAAGVDFIPTTHTDEVHSGDGTQTLIMGFPKVQSVTAGSIRTGTTWTDLTALELAYIFVDPDCDSRIYYEGYYWPRGVANVKLTYSSGFAVVPELVKEAALTACVEGLPVSNAPFEASGYDAGGTTYTFERADGYNGAWSKLPVVMRALRLYGFKTTGIA